MARNMSSCPKFIVRRTRVYSRPSTTTAAHAVVTIVKTSSSSDRDCSWNRIRFSCNFRIVYIPLDLSCSVEGEAEGEGRTEKTSPSLRLLVSLFKTLFSYIA